MYCTCQLCEVERLVPMLDDCVFAVHKCSIEIEENSCKGLPLDWSGKRWLLDIRRHDELFFEKVTWKLCGAKMCLCMLLHTYGVQYYENKRERIYGKFTKGVR